MSQPTRRPDPRPWRFIITGALLGAAALAALSLSRPDRAAGYDITYTPSVTLGFMTMLGLFLGGLLGAIVAAILAGGPDRRR